MMKIKVFYDKNLKLLKIPAVLKIPHKRIVTDFVLDTGSPYTLLNYSDSIRLGIPHIIKSELIRIGGRTYQSYIFNKCEIIFKAIENKEVKETIPVRVLKPSSLKIEEIGQLDKFPNLLGLDFLEIGFKFFCDITQGDIYLEKMKKEEKEINKLRQKSEEYASSQGFKLNPDEKIVDFVIKGLLKNKEAKGELYCPCRQVSGNKEEDIKIICPCIYHLTEIKEEGKCHCGLFMK